MSNAILSCVPDTVRLVEEAVERIKNDGDQTFPSAASIGDAVRQGDIYIQLIDDFEGVPALYKKLENVPYPLQLAPGNTKGSRHMLEESAGAEVFVVDLEVDQSNSTDDDVLFTEESQRAFATKVDELAQAITNESQEERNRWQSRTRRAGALIADAIDFSGPIMKLKNSATVSHPEHGNWVLPAGTYRVTFQRTVDSTARIRRVLD
jgi:hypothetical protein